MVKGKHLLNNVPTVWLSDETAEDVVAAKYQLQWPLNVKCQLQCVDCNCCGGHLQEYFLRF